FTLLAGVIGCSSASSKKPKPTPTPEPTFPPPPPPAAPTIPHGVYDLEAQGATINSTALANPSVDGISIRQNWDALEPSDGVFDYTYFDAQIALAAAAGKKILLRVSTGGDDATITQT